MTTVLNFTGRSSLTDGLVSYWKFEEGSGTSAYDSSGFNHTGTLSGGTPPAWTTGRSGGGLSFDGATSYIVVLGDALLNPAELTVAAWVNQTVGGSFQQIVSYDFNNGYRYRIKNDQKVQFLNVGGTNTISTTATISTGVWTHLAITGSASGLAIYINGVSAASNGTAFIRDATTTNFDIGDAPGSGELFNGLMDEIRVYNRALTSAEVAALAAM